MSGRPRPKVYDSYAKPPSSQLDVHEHMALPDSSALYLSASSSQIRHGHGNCNFAKVTVMAHTIMHLLATYLHSVLHT